MWVRFSSAQECRDNNLETGFVSVGTARKNSLEGMVLFQDAITNDALAEYFDASGKGIYLAL
jgi:hypothetical protein